MKPNRPLLALAFAVFVGASLAAQQLASVRFDNPSSLGLVITTEPADKPAGAKVVKISTKWPTTVCLGEVQGPGIDDARLVYSARVKTALQGSAYLEMWVHVAGGQYFSRGLDNQAQGTADWRVLQTPFFLQKGQKPSKVTLNVVINGAGTVWVGDVALSKAPLK